jgi:hypothetical protein
VKSNFEKYFFQDPTLWKPASINPSKNFNSFESIPVEIFITTKDAYDKLNKILYSITDFKPFIDLEIEDYSVIIFKIYLLKFFLFLVKSNCYQFRHLAGYIVQEEKI